MTEPDIQEEVPELSEAEKEALRQKQIIHEQLQEQFIDVLNHFFSEDLCFNKHGADKRYKFKDGTSSLVGYLIPSGWYFQSTEEIQAQYLITEYPGIHQVFPDRDFLIALDHVDRKISEMLRYEQEWRGEAIRLLTDMIHKFDLRGTEMLENASILI